MFHSAHHGLCVILCLGPIPSKLPSSMSLGAVFDCGHPQVHRITAAPWYFDTTSDPDSIPIRSRLISRPVVNLVECVYHPQLMNRRHFILLQKFRNNDGNITVHPSGEWSHPQNTIPVDTLQRAKANDTVMLAKKRLGNTLPKTSDVGPSAKVPTDHRKYQASIQSQLPTVDCR